MPYCAVPSTLAGMSKRGRAVPTIVYSAFGFSFGARGGEFGRLGRQFAECRAAAARLVMDMAPFGHDFRCRHAPAARGGAAQHVLRGGAGDTHAVMAGEADRGRAAGQLQVHEFGDLQHREIGDAEKGGRDRDVAGEIAAGEAVIGEGAGRRGLFHAHQLPVGLHFLGRHHRQRGVDALAHVGMGDIDRHHVVGGELDPGRQQAFVTGGDSTRRGGPARGAGKCEAQQQAAASDATRDQQLTARGLFEFDGHDALPQAAVTERMAARMRG